MTTHQAALLAKAVAEYDRITGSLEGCPGCDVDALEAAFAIIEAELTAECEGLKATLARTQSAAKSGMDAATEVGRWQMEEARRLKAECSPVSIASQREANERLTNELQIEKQAREAAEARVVKLREALTDMRSGWRYIREFHGDLYGVAWDRCEQSATAALADPEA